MSKLTRDGTAEPVSEGQIHRREPDREIFIFPAQLTTSRIGNLIRLILTLATVRRICIEKKYPEYLVDQQKNIS